MFSERVERLSGSLIREILAAAQRHLNAAPTASMAEIASAAGIGRATLHRHFASRDALLAEIADRSLGRWEMRLDAAEVEAVGGLGDDVGGQIGGAQRHGQHGLHGTDSDKERLRRIV